MKTDYSAPNCIIIRVNETTDLMKTSFPSQHNPGIHGTGPSSDTQNASSWKD